MKRKRFVKLMRALSVQIRKDGFRDRDIEFIVEMLHRHKMFREPGHHQLNYQLIWEINRDVQREKILKQLEMHTEAMARSLEFDEEDIEYAKEIRRAVAIAARPIFLVEK